MKEKMILVRQNLIFKILLYAICLALISFYLYVFYLGFHPQVSDLYRAFYIEHSISQWPE